jgi:hypothetical protein
MYSNKLNTNELNINELEKYNLKIITMTIGCSTKNNFDLHNISNNITLHPNKILSVKYKTTTGKIIIRNANPNINISNKCFNNQVTIIIPIISKKNINVKVFPNGKMQFTGCKNLSEFEYAYNILCNNLLTNKNNLVKEDEIIIYNLDFQMINVKYIS